MSGSVHETAADGFGAVADEYERARPDYPAEAVARLTELGIGADGRTLDLGAGTGKLARMLVPSRLFALEPLASMRERFASVIPEVPLVAGVAEAIPFSGGAFRGVVCAQAFHWFDGRRALAEIHRVLEPGGTLALLWNVKDESVPWVRELGDILRPYQDRIPQETSGEWRRAFGDSNLFGELEEARFSHAQQLDIPGLVERYASASYVAVLPEDERLDVLRKVEHLAETHPDTAGKAAFDLPYVTELYWSVRR